MMNNNTRQSGHSGLICKNSLKPIKIRGQTILNLVIPKLINLKVVANINTRWETGMTHQKSHERGDLSSLPFSKDYQHRQLQGVF